MISLKDGFKFSTLVHGALLIAMLGSFPMLHFGCGGKGDGDSKEEQEKKKGSKAQEDKQQIKDKEAKDIEIDIVDVPVTKSDEQIAFEKAKKFQENCTPYFGGVGLTHNGYGGIVKVYKYYPAWEAGLKEGDLIWNIEDLRGPIGTEVIIRYSRDQVRHEVKVKRGRICLEDKELGP